MTVAEHLVVLDVLAAEGQAVPSDVLEWRHGDDAFREALWHGPLWHGPLRERATGYGSEVYYAGPEAATDRAVGRVRGRQAPGGVPCRLMCPGGVSPWRP